MSRSAHPAGPRHANEQSAGSVSAAGPPDEPEALNPKIWPSSVARSATGELVLAGVSASRLAAEYGTPLFALDEADLRSRARGYAEAFAGADVFYAGKAFLCTAVARIVADEGLGLDVCTGGELALALRAGVDPARIAMHGNNKSLTELHAAVTAGVGRIVLDSEVEIGRLAQICRQEETRQRVLIRVTVGVEAHTHEFIATAHEDQKFGFSLATGAAEAAVAAVLEHPALELVGLHSHIGSQIFDMAGFEVAAHRIIGLLAGVRDRFGRALAEVDLGGGLGIAYVDGDAPEQPAEIAAALREIIAIECARAGLPVPRLSVEPGRAIIGPTMITLYEVGTVKSVILDSGQSRNYLSVDGGMSDNIRTALYDAAYTVTLANRSSTAPARLSRVVGKHCESGDVVVRDCWLPADVGPGDLLAVAATGAYCYAMASNYNRQPRPAVVSVADGTGRIIVRRESLDDVMATDVGWDAATTPVQAGTPGQAATAAQAATPAQAATAAQPATPSQAATPVAAAGALA